MSHALALQNASSTAQAQVEEFHLPAFVCVADARHRNEQNYGSYTTTQSRNAEALFGLITTVFPCNRVYLNYRQRFAAIKVDSLSARDNATVKAAKLEVWAMANNIQVEKTRYGHVVYRFTREQLGSLTIPQI